MTTADDHLIYERRMRPRQAAIAGLAGVLLMAAAIAQLAGPHTKVEELTLDLITAHKRFPLDVIAAVINAFGLLALAGTLTFLFRVIRARNPQVQSFIRILSVAGAGVAGLSGLAYSALIASKASDFVHSGAQTYQEANHLTSSGAIVALQLLDQAALLVLAIGFVLTSLNAMRVGLLTRFMGYLGIFAAVLILFQLTQVPVVEGYWLLALAVLFAGRWPTGLPPSWQSGRAEPWPSGQQMREQRANAIAARRGGRGRAPARAPEPEPVAAPAPRAPRQGAQKRKRKRRK